MKNKTLPLKELTISEIYNGDKATYEVPIYQRNYAWEKDEISALIQDVYDAFIVNKQTYYIGTLVSFHKGDQIYEIIDGQQRLTTIYLILKALEIDIQNKLRYKARKKSNYTIKSIPKFDVDEKDLLPIARTNLDKKSVVIIMIPLIKDEVTFMQVAGSTPVLDTSKGKQSAYKKKPLFLK